MPYKKPDLRYRFIFVVFVVLLFSFLLWRGGGPARVILPRTLVLYCFSIMADAMDEGILPAFRRAWQEKAGEQVEFITTYAGSGTITRKIIQRFPAEVAILASELDLLRLSGAGVYADRSGMPSQGIVTRSPLVICVRPGNPKGISDYLDLAKPDVQLIHADPLTSGGGEWSILSVYGSAWRASQDSELAARRLTEIWENVIEVAPSARLTRDRFRDGIGDATITYEKEAVADWHVRRIPAEIIYPPSTIVSEHLVVKIEKNIDSRQRELVDAFVAFLWSREAQTILVAHGFRSADSELNGRNPLLGTVKDPFTLQDLGGPRLAMEGAIKQWQTRILPAGRWLKNPPTAERTSSAQAE